MVRTVFRIGNHKSSDMVGRSKRLFVLCFVLSCVVALYELFAPCNTVTMIRSFTKALRCQFEMEYKDVEIIGINRKNTRKDSKAKYILLLPRSVECSTCSISSWSLVGHLTNLLSSMNDFDGASCYGDSQKNKSCRFYTKRWSMVINKEAGNVITRKVDNQKFQFYNCNIVEGPVLLRRDIFERLGLRPSHGDTTLLDLYLRSKGDLKIAYSLDCAFSKEQLVANRGAMTSKEIYLDYGLLGYHHDILRIIYVYDNTIIWTQCTRTANPSLCPNKPLQDIHTSNKLSHYCCNVALNKYLIDAVYGLEQAGIDYRLCYGTTLGAIRSKNIIPWTRDIDIHVTLTDYHNSYAFSKLRQVMENMHYSTPLVFQLRRIIPQFPLTTHINNLSVYNLFSEATLEQLRDALPFEKPDWGTLGYVDIYPYEDHPTFGQPSYITINGQQYKSHSDPQSHLVKAFGESWREVNYRFKSKDPHKPWIWQFDTSLKQEDTSISSNCSFYVSIIFINMLLVIMYGIFRAILIIARKSFQYKNYL